MTCCESRTYYTSRSDQLLAGFDDEAQRWRTILVQREGAAVADQLLDTARQEFRELLPRIPYIGGDENHLTDSLLESVRCLALFKAMAAAGSTAAETGKVLYDAVLAHAADYVSRVSPEPRLSEAELMRRRRERAARSQQRLYPDDWVYTIIQGDGCTFDYGYRFLRCATDRFFRAEGAAEFTPYYCFLDFPKCELAGLGLTRSQTLSEGHPYCEFRFKLGGSAQWRWPPPFLAQDPEQKA